MTTSAPQGQPNSWLRDLARLKPAPWPWGLSIRSAVCIGAPFAVGVLADDVLTGMWVSMGTLMQASGERAGPYREIFRQILLATPIGAAGYLAGYLVGPPWIVTVLAMGLIGVGAGLLSSYGAIWSIGALQALLLASIAIGVPEISPFWWPALLYLAGAGIYAAVLAIEAWLMRHRSVRLRQAGMAASLAGLARALADQADPGGADRVEIARRGVTDTLASFYATLLDGVSRYGASGEISRVGAAVLHRCDTLFALLLVDRDRESLDRLATRLREIEMALRTGRPLPAGGPVIGDRDLAHAVDDLALAVRAGGSAGRALPVTAVRAAAGRRLAVALDRLAPGPAAVRAALALGLCIAVAYAGRWVIHASHWFWIPLTVGLIMKPDFGSIFARSILRCAGAIGGVLIGAVLLTLLPKGMPLVIAMTILGGLLPWAMRRSYALQAVVLTPLILILVDIIVPGTTTDDYALQRLIDTFIGAGLVLLVGYFPWPRRHRAELATTFHRAMDAVASYLGAAAAARTGAGPVRTADVADRRRSAYGQLSTLRARLQVALMEPPPAGREAAAWFPIVAAAERICDRITAFSVETGPPLESPDIARLQQLADSLVHLSAPGRASASVSNPSAAALVAAGEAEVQQIIRMSTVTDRS